MLPIRAGFCSRFLPLDDTCLPGAGDEARRGQPRCFTHLCEVPHQLSDGDVTEQHVPLALPVFFFTKGMLHGLVGFWFDVIRRRSRPRQPREAR